MLLYLSTNRDHPQSTHVSDLRRPSLRIFSSIFNTLQSAHVSVRCCTASPIWTISSLFLPLYLCVIYFFDHFCAETKNGMTRLVIHRNMFTSRARLQPKPWINVQNQTRAAHSVCPRWRKLICQCCVVDKPWTCADTVSKWPQTWHFSDISCRLSADICQSWCICN